MLKSAPRVDQAPSSVGVAAAAPLPYFDSRPSIVSVSTRAALGPSSVTVPNGTGYLTFPAGDGELNTGPADAHPRSEAAYPIVQSFVSVVKKPVTGVERKLTIAKGQPILFLPLGDKVGSTDGTTVEQGTVVTSMKNKVLADRRYRGSAKYLAVVGQNTFSDKYALSSGYVAFAAEPTAIRFEESDDFSEMTAISCALEYESDVLATACPKAKAPEYFPAGTAILAGIYYEDVENSSGEPTATSKYCIRACAGLPSTLHDMCEGGNFVPRRCATAIVPFVALPLNHDGDLTVVPPVRAAIIARPFPSTVM